MRYLSLCGLLGYGYPREHVACALDRGIDFIGVDAGSTDPGPYYLGAGHNFVSAAQVQADLAPALAAALGARIPLIVGSAGGAGARPHVDEFMDIVRQVAREAGLHPRVAVIHADVPAKTVLAALREGRIAPCDFAPALTEERVLACTRIVAQMGALPIIRALRGGADVVVAGRCCDAAIFAALPVMRGADPGPALHCGKIAECGTLCAEEGGANDSLLCTVGAGEFIVEPLSAEKHCTPESVAAHSLYEQPHPDRFTEVEGVVDLSECSFEAVDDRRVRVRGSRLLPAERCAVKLEGAALRGYRAVTIAGARDPLVIEHLPLIERRVRETVGAQLSDALAGTDWSLRFIRYGGGATGAGDAGDYPAGIVIEALGPTQALADAILSLARSTALHQRFEGRKTTAGNLAFPFSPSDLQGGPGYEFAIYHLMHVDDPAGLFPVSLEEL